MRLSVKNHSFNNDIYNILLNFNNGIVNPILPSFTQVHYSHLNIKSVVGVYPMIDYKTDDIFELNESAK